MIVPNKITPYKKSIIGKIPIVLEMLKQCAKSPTELWEDTQNQFEDINEFILTLDVAFVLGAIEYLKGNRVIKYVKTDNM
ncbi:MULTISPECIES: ABC-three component system middle component 7 [Eubacteriales]|uniref:ABC-three component system middle component 7 n=1 Tax=Eubacteriales TaxID=186802 RepID=UPI0004104148|nr:MULTISPECIES: ABC-three component system middle component 7 [Eubacteriales]